VARLPQDATTSGTWSLSEKEENKRHDRQKNQPTGVRKARAHDGKNFTCGEERRCSHVVGVTSDGEPSLSIEEGDGKTAEGGLKTEGGTSNGPDAKGCTTQREQAHSKTADGDHPYGNATDRDPTHGDPAKRKQASDSHVADRNPTSGHGARDAGLGRATDSNVDEGETEQTS
jgi:hypothetical protein